MRLAKTLTAFALPALLCPVAAKAGPILPDDPTVAGSLALWARQAGTNFNGTTWADSSGNGNDLNLPITTSPQFTSPTVPVASAPTITAGAYSGQTVNGVLFRDTQNDLLGADLGPTNNLTQATIFVVYSTPDTSSGTRPAGIGSPSAGTGDINNFHIAIDGSLRYDNGANTGVDDPSGELLVRAARFNSSLVTNWQFTGDTIDVTIGPNADNGGSAGSILSSDQFFLGDIRTGSTSNVSGGGTAGEVFISSAIAYTGALTDDQVVGIIEFLALTPEGNPALIPEPGSLLLVAAGAGAVGLLRRRAS
ncbi:MAG: PEP-CTERM sorting domain-containing protein [Planctomycetota bacterium]